MLDFVCAKALVKIGIDVQDNAPETLVLRNARRRRCTEMLVKRTSVNAQNPAQGFDRMLETELMDSI